MIRLLLRFLKQKLLLMKKWLLRTLPGERFEKYESQIEEVEGLLMQGEKHWLYERAKSLPDGATIVEIGCYKGCSTVALGYGCLNSNKHIYSIDTFNGNETDFTGPGRRDFYDHWERNVHTNSLRSYVTPIVAYSQKALQKWNKPIDFIFIDGSHVYEDVLADFDGFYKHLKPGGVLSMHDTGNPGHPGVLKVWQERGLNLLEKTSICTSIAYGFKPLNDD